VRVKFQADANLNQHIVSGVLRRIPEMDFQTSREAGLENLPDNEELSLAAREGRILVTHDRRTMPWHFAKFLILQTSPGVFLVPKRRSVRTIIEELTLIWYASEAKTTLTRLLHCPCELAVSYAPDSSFLSEPASAGRFDSHTITGFKFPASFRPNLAPSSVAYD
jgi:hypothetical protein